MAKRLQTMCAPGYENGFEFTLMPECLDRPSGRLLSGRSSDLSPPNEEKDGGLAHFCSEQKESPTILKSFKQWLWEGDIEAIVEKCRQYFKRPSQEINQYIGYLDKNKGRMQYAEFRNKKLVCGSGVIESGIRRVINLRFKNSSAFWKPENVEGLYFLRGILLAFRWDILMDNLIQS